jgi:hypothetical protein
MDCLDEESNRIKEIYAHFGLAIYCSQCLERTISFALLSVFNIDVKNTTREMFDFELERNFKKTLGFLLKELKERQSLNDNEELHYELVKILYQRNWLVNHYFWDRAIQFMDKNGQVNMLNELEEIAERFHEMDAKIIELVQDWRRTKGISDETVQQTMDEMLSEYSRNQP